MIYKKSLHFLFSVLLLIHSLFLLPSVAGHPSTQKEKQELKKLQAAIEMFLNSWLVEHDVEKARQHFSVASTLNEMMLSADCAGYINDEDRKSKAAVQAGIEKFLRDFTTGNPGRSLSEQLGTSRISPPSQSNVLNDVQKDRYLLVKFISRKLQKIIQERKVIDQLRKETKGKSFYISFIQIGNGVLYFVWLQSAGQWQVYHADMVCI